MIIASVFSVSCKTELVYYQVRFNSNGGSTVTTQTVESGKTASMPGNPVRTGYTFLGWYSDKACEYLYTFTQPVKSDLTLYAKWSGSAVTVTYIDGSGNTKTVTAQPGTYSLMKNSDPTATLGLKASDSSYTDFSKKDNSFGKWRDASTGKTYYEEAEIELTENITLEVLWSNGLEMPNSDGSVEAVKTAGSVLPESIVIPRVFSEWNGNTEMRYEVTKIAPNGFSGTNLVSVDIASSVTEIGDCAFSNCTSLVEVKMSSKEAPQLGDNAFEDSVTVYVPEGSTGYDSGKWTDVAVETEPEVTYSVIYDGNKNDGGNAPVDGINHKPNDEVTILDNTGNLTKTNHIFICWNTKADGSGTDYEVGESFKITDNLKLYAKWVKGDFSKCVLFTSSSSFSITTTPGWTAPGYVEYSTDGLTWETWDGSSVSGTQIGFRGKGNNVIAGSSSNNWQITGSDVSVSGNIMTLLDYDNPDSQQMGNYCFCSMFEGQDALISAGDLKLSATKLAPACYYKMFRNCTVLADAPSIEATELAVAAVDQVAPGVKYGCCQQMFQSCTSLKTASELHATVLTEKCYQQMFDGCSNLATAPVISATKLASECCMGMFLSCTSLNSITVSFTDWNTSGDSTEKWFVGAKNSSDCIFHGPSTLKLKRGDSYIPSNWTVDGPTDFVEYLTFTGEDSFTIEAKEYPTGQDIIPWQDSTKPDSYIEYSLDNGKNWSKWLGAKITVNATAGYKIQFRGRGNTVITGPSNNEPYWFIIPSSFDPYDPTVNPAKVSCSGNIMTLLDWKHYDDAECPKMGDHCFSSLLNNSYALANAEDLILPVKDLTGSPSCYTAMFMNDINLKTAPTLPATVLSKRCYTNMFNDCESLTKAPDLPALKLTERCYLGMFEECKALVNPPKIDATAITDPASDNSCCYEMFHLCTSLETAPVLHATVMSDSCYDSMFRGCVSLTKAPDLPATTLAKSCYAAMFGQTTRDVIIEGKEKEIIYYCGITEAPALEATDLAEYCYQDMFLGCKNLTAAPALPATTLKESCYWTMFMGCSSLKVGKVEAPSTTIPAGGTKIFTCPNTSGFNNAVQNMFFKTGGTFTGDPTSGNTYYWYTE